MFDVDILVSLNGKNVININESRVHGKYQCVIDCVRTIACDIFVGAEHQNDYYADIQFVIIEMK